MKSIYMYIYIHIKKHKLIYLFKRTWLHRKLGVLVPQPGTEPAPLTVKVQNL